MTINDGSVESDQEEVTQASQDTPVTPVKPVSLKDAVREVKILQRLGHHENIVRCYAAQYSESDNVFNIFLDFVSG